MPTDGADFGRMKACYGKAYTALRSGVDDADVAEIIVRGVERDIRRDGGAPAFGPVVKLVVLVSSQASAASHQQLIRNIDELARLHGGSSLARHVLDAAVKVGLAALNGGESLCQHEAAKRILVQIGRSRCDGMSAYATKHRTHSIATTQTLIGSVSQELNSAPSLNDFARRMLNATPSGLPAKAAKAPRIEHSADNLNNTSLEGGL